MSLPNINDIPNYTPSMYRSRHRLENNYNVPIRINWSNVIQNNPVDEVQELDKSEIDSEIDNDSDNDTDNLSDNSVTQNKYYKSLINLKNKTLNKQERNNNALRTLFKTVIEHQDRCQIIESDVKSIQQNEITLHENYIGELEKKFEKYKKKLQSLSLSNEINKVRIERIEKQNNQLIKQTQCVICREKERSILFLPCKHCICCEECSNTLYTDKCPTCRTDITEKQCIFLN